MLSERYELVERIGQGASAEVWKARDRRLDRMVAIKRLRPDVEIDLRVVARFEREARTAAGLNHPNIVAVYDTGVDDGVPWMAMELISGPTLADAIGPGGIPVERAIPIANGVLAALGQAHQVGLVHRDIKPANIMLGEGDQVKVVDFGITTNPEVDPRLTATGTVVGTLAYLAPEVAAGRLPSASSDLYSVGVVMFEMITGRKPFPGSTLAEAVLAHQQETAPRLSAFTSVPPHVDAVVSGLMAKDPAERFASAEEVITALEGGVEDDGTRVIPVIDSPAPPGVGAPSRFWPAALVVVAVLVAALLVAGGDAPATDPIALPTTLATTTTTVPTTTVPPTTTLPPTTTTVPPTTTPEDLVEDIARAIEETLRESAVRNGVANALNKAVGDAIKNWLEDDRSEAAQKLEEAFAIADDINLREVEQTIEQLLVELAEAMGFEVRR